MPDQFCYGGLYYHRRGQDGNTEIDWLKIPSMSLVNFGMIASAQG